MALGRISGPLLKANLLRDGVDLAFETDLLYIDVSNMRVGIRTDAPTHDLHVNGNTKTNDLQVTNDLVVGDLIINGNTITGTQDVINLAGSGLYPLVEISATLKVADITIDGNIISTNTTNTNLEILSNGTGIISIPSNDVVIDQNLTVNGSTNINGSVDIGQTLTVGQTLNVGSLINTDDIRIAGNRIETTASNSNLELDTVGSGSIELLTNTNITGTFQVTGNSVLGTTDGDTIDVRAEFVSGLVPDITDTYDLGTITNRWNQIHAVTADIGDVAITGTTIESTALNSDLYINANGSGGVIINNLLSLDSSGSLSFDGDTVNFNNISINGDSDYSVIRTVDSNTNLYLDAAGTGTINLTSNTNITGNLDVTGDITIGGNLRIGDQDTDTITVTADFTSDLVPDASNTYDLGTPAKEWRTVYAGQFTNGNIVIDDNYIRTTDSNSNLELSASGVGTIELQSDVNITGNVSISIQAILASANVEDLTSGRIVLAGVNGELEDSANLTFDGTELTIIGDFTVTDNTDINNDLSVGGDVNISGDVFASTINTDDIRIVGNRIETTASNSNLELNANGTGTIELLKDATVIGALTATDVYGNIFTNFIDSADSSAVTVKPAAIFNSDVTIENDFIANRVIINDYLDLAGNKLINLAAPVAEQDAATKAYVDEVALGLKSRPAVEVATTGNLDAVYYNGDNNDGIGSTLTGVSNGAFLQIDSITLASIVPGSNGVLVKNQSNPAHNGRYNLTTVGNGSEPWVLTRCPLCDESNEIAGSYIFVKQGTLYRGTGWVLTVDDPTIFVVGVDNIIVTQFSGPGAYSAGIGLTLNITEFSVNAELPHVTEVGSLTGLDVNGNVTVSGYIDIDQGLRLEQNTIKTLDSNADIELRPSGVGTVIVDSDQALKIPVGSNSVRPSGLAGQIRFNSDSNQFEGYNGIAWSSLGGVRDVDGDTYITPEVSPGSDEDTLFFYTNGELAATLDKNQLSTKNILVGGIRLDGNVIKTVESNADLELSANGSGYIYINGPLNVVGPSSNINGITISGTTIDTQDSSTLNIEPAVILNSDVTVGNNLYVENIKAKNNNSNVVIETSGAGVVDVTGTRIVNVLDPIDLFDAANKNYVDTNTQILTNYVDNSTQILNVMYVSKSGNDANDGLSMGKSKLTIKSALQTATNGTTIFVKSGDYTENNPLTVPEGVSIIGDNLRTVTVRPLNKTQDLFYVNNSVYLAHMTFKDHERPSAAVAFNPNGSAGVIHTSPYVQNCTSMTTTGTGMRIDGAHCGGLRSMVVDAYTQYNQGGIGMHHLNRGNSQLVSVFTICCDIGFLCESGGFCSITNSNSSFGNVGIKATGISPSLYSGKTNGVTNGSTITIDNLTTRPNVSDVLIVAGDTVTYKVVSSTAFTSGGTSIVQPNYNNEPADAKNTRQLVLNNKPKIQADVIDFLNETYPTLDFNQFKATRDAGLIIDAAVDDMMFGTNYKSVQAGLAFYRNTSANLLATQKTEVLASLNFLKTEVLELITSDSTQGPEYVRISNNITEVIDIIDNGIPAADAYIFPSPTAADVDRIYAHDIVRANRNFLIEEGIAYITVNYPSLSYDQTKCRRDIGFIVDAISYDILYEGNSQTADAADEYYSTGTLQVPIGEKQATIDTFTYLRSIISSIATNSPIVPLNGTVTQNTSLPSTDNINMNRLYDLFGIVVNLIENAYTSIVVIEGSLSSVADNTIITFHQPSLVTSSGHTFEWVGSGTNVNTALPYLGGTAIQENEIIEELGGIVNFTSTDHRGDFRIGEDLVINRDTGTISGRTFTKSLFAVMTPYILAIGE